MGVVTALYVGPLHQGPTTPPSGLLSHFLIQAFFKCKISLGPFCYSYYLSYCFLLLCIHFLYMFHHFLFYLPGIFTGAGSMSILLTIIPGTQYLLQKSTLERKKLSSGYMRVNINITYTTKSNFKCIFFFLVTGKYPEWHQCSQCSSMLCTVKLLSPKYRLSVFESQLCHFPAG